jgi:hypothetical protein
VAGLNNFVLILWQELIVSRNVIVTSQAGLHVAIFKLAKSSEAMIFRHMALLSCAGQLIFFFYL